MGVHGIPSNRMRPRGTCRDTSMRSYLSHWTTRQYYISFTSASWMVRVQCTLGQTTCNLSNRCGSTAAETIYEISSPTRAAQPIDHAASKEDSALPGLSMICVAGKDKANRCRCGILAFPRYKSYETPIQQPVGWRVGTHTATEHRKIVQDTC